jgi:hypothetical protein
MFNQTSQFRGWLATLLGAFLLFTAQGSLAQEQTGRQILDESHKRHTQNYEVESQKMTIYANDAVTETRELRRLTRKMAEGETRYLMNFNAPRGVKGVALLTWSFDKRDDDQWLYMPGDGRTKRIAKGGRRTAFMGTDFTYEDLVTESRDKFKYDRLPDESINGVPHFVVEAGAIDPDLVKETGYKSRRLYLIKSNYFIARIDYTDRRGELFKRQTMSDITNVQGTAWRANTARMENLRDKTATVITVLSRNFAESNVPERMFLERFLTAQEHMK